MVLKVLHSGNVNWVLNWNQNPLCVAWHEKSALLICSLGGGRCKILFQPRFAFIFVVFVSVPVKICTAAHSQPGWRGRRNWCITVMLDLPIPWQSNLNGTSCFTKVTSSTLGTFLIFEKAWAGVGLWRMSIGVYIIHFIQYKMITIYLNIEKYLGKSNQENCVPKKVIRMGKKMATFCRNGRKQWWRRRAGDPLWTSGFLPPPAPPSLLAEPLPCVIIVYVCPTLWLLSSVKLSHIPSSPISSCGTRLHFRQ